MPAVRTYPPLISVGLYPDGPLRELLDIARILDASRIDTLWIGDSPLLWHEVWTSMALSLAATETLRFGTAVTNPRTRHWSVTAAAVQTLHEFAPGRLRLGIGVGDSALRRFAGKVATLDELEEAVTAIRSLLAGQPLPAPLADIRWDKPAVAVDVVVSGSGPRTLERAGRLGAAAMVIPGLRADYLAQVRARVDDGARAAGRDPERVGKVLWVACSVGPDGEAQAAVRPWVASVLRHPLAFDLDEETERLRQRIAAEYDFGKHMAVSGDHGVELPERIVHDFALAGPVPTVAARLQEAMQLPVDEVALVLMGKDKRSQARGVREALALVSQPGGSPA